MEEPPIGDATRALPPVVGDGESAAHAALNRNKRSIVLDLRTEDGAATVRRLVQGADVFVEAYRPGALARRGLGATALLEANPRLVYCSITGYGQDGPLADRAGHDLSYLSLSGFLGANRGPAGRPVIPAAQVADMTAAYVAVIGILAALVARETTGRGQQVDVSLLRAALGLMSLPLARRLAGARHVDELTGTYACYTVYACRDGRYLSVAALEPKFWEGLCRGLERPDLASRQWDRGARGQEVKDALGALFATRERDEWVRRLAPLDVCVEPVLDLDEAAATPAVAAEMGEQPAGGASLRTVGPPVRFPGLPAAERRAAPALGEHSAEVLARAGLDEAEIARLFGAGVVA